MTSIRVAALVSVVALLVAGSAFAGEKGLVTASGGVLKAEPKPKAKKGDKIKQGMMIDVVDHSPDGMWVKLQAQGADGNVEGWIEKTYVRSLSRYGFTWERKSSAGGNQTTGKPVTAADAPVTTTKNGPAPAADEGWGKDDPATAAADSEWEKTDAPPVEAAATAAPAATPAAEEGWGNEGGGSGDEGWGSEEGTK